jgi:glycosyltransferase involved in cell wall biosynthesis
MKALSTVSVVIPAFNAERFLADALHSVFSQKAPAHEVVVVDDGSTDRTAAVATEFPLVRLLSIPHSGVSTARNFGVASTIGEFIAFLDADDTWDPLRLELQLELAQREPAVGIVMAQQTYRFEGPIPSWFRGPVDGRSEAGFMPSNWLVRRSAWEFVGEFDREMTHSEDTDWLARASDLGVQVGVVEVPLVVHRIHDSNASGMAGPVRERVLHALGQSVRRKQRLGS